MSYFNLCRESPGANFNNGTSGRGPEERIEEEAAGEQTRTFLQTQLSAPFPRHPVHCSNPIRISKARGSVSFSILRCIAKRGRMKTRLLLPWTMLLAPALVFAMPTEEELSP